MKTLNLAATFFLFFWLSNVGFSQTPSPTPPIEESDDVVKISTNLIQFDVTVTDKKGNVIKDLKPEDFEIFENGEVQEITNLSFIPLSSEETAVAPNISDKTPAPPPNKLKPGQVRRTYAIIVDDFSISFENAYFIKNALKKFINEQMQDGDLVAIIRTSGGIGILQSFTSDKRLLLAAATKVRWNPLNDKIESFESVRTANIPLEEDGDPIAKQINAQTKDFLNNVQIFRNNTLSFGMLGALKSVINGMKDLPGRKSVMLFSEGFNFYKNDRDNKNSDSQATQPVKTLDSQIFQQVQVLIDLANRGSITFYPIDPRGLDAAAATAADDTSDFNLKDFTPFDDPIANISINRQNSLRDSQDSLRYLAQETGGKAYVNQNKINAGMQKVLDDQSGFYIIGYQPDAQTFDPQKSKFNKVIVKVKRPDLRVRYRSGFFGVTDEKIKPIVSTTQQLTIALTSPFGANDINLDLYSIFVNDESNKKSIRSFLHIDTKNLKLTKIDGFYRGSYEFMVAAFGNNGSIVDQAMKRYNFQFDERLYKRFLELGFNYNLNLPVKKAGAYQLRIAVRDVDSGKIGSASQYVEVPDIDKKKLTLSNLILKNYSLLEWKKITTEQNLGNQDTNFFSDTTLRQFKRGTILAYSYIIYNTKTGAGQTSNIQIQTKLYRDGKLFLEGTPAPLKSQNQTNLQRIEISDAITLGTDLKAGDYILQLIVSDNSGKSESKTASQSIDFEIND